MDSGLLGSLMDRHAAALELYARQWCNEPEDVVQEAFVKLAVQRSTPIHTGAWLFRTVRNGAINAGITSQRRRRHEAEAAAVVPAWFETSLSARRAGTVDPESAQTALSRLPLDQREIIVAHLWASMTLETEPKSLLRIVMQAKDTNAANDIQKISGDALNLLAKESLDTPALTKLAKAIGQIKPQMQGDRVVLEADLEKTAELVAVPIRQAREAARRSQCTNNLKQIALAMLNYHSAHNTFPAAYSSSKNGKPLLSWRVHILPFLEQQALYNEFHQDEAWDSPHNKALISRMPPQYACPGGSQTLAKEGKTTYLTPRGPATIFPGDQGIKIQEITDGTSNTLLIVDATDDLAVIWTKPDDWEVPAEVNPAVLVGHHMRGINAGFADGSVHFFKATIPGKTLKALTTRNGGEVTNSNDF